MNINQEIALIDKIINYLPKLEDILDLDRSYFQLTLPKDVKEIYHDYACLFTTPAVSLAVMSSDKQHMLFNIFINLTKQTATWQDFGLDPHFNDQDLELFEQAQAKSDEITQSLRISIFN